MKQSTSGVARVSGFTPSRTLISRPTTSILEAQHREDKGRNPSKISSMSPLRNLAAPWRPLFHHFHPPPPSRNALERLHPCSIPSPANIWTTPMRKGPHGAEVTQEPVSNFAPSLNPSLVIFGRQTKRPLPASRIPLAKLLRTVCPKAGHPARSNMMNLLW